MSPTQSTFAPADRQQWLTLIDKVLKGAPADSLTRHDEDGLAINALYDPVPVTGDIGVAVSVTRLPCDPARHIAHGWDICQPIDVANHMAGDTTRVNQLIMDELADGVGSLWFHGLGDDSAMAPMLDGVMLSAVGLCLDSGASAMTHLGALETVARQHGHRLCDITVDVNIDPFGPAGDPQLLAAGLSLLGTADRTDLPRGLFAAGGWHWHNRGMTAVEELAYILACLADILRHGHNAGLDLAFLASRLSAQLALPADLFAGIAKIRALRHCWAAVVAPLGLTVALPIHALVSRRMFSCLDIEVNMLRTTTALLGGAIGGATGCRPLPMTILVAAVLTAAGWPVCNSCCCVMKAALPTALIHQVARRSSRPAPLILRPRPGPRFNRLKPKAGPCRGTNRTGSWQPRVPLRPAGSSVLSRATWRWLVGIFKRSNGNSRRHNPAGSIYPAHRPRST